LPFNLAGKKIAGYGQKRGLSAVCAVPRPLKIAGLPIVVLCQNLVRQELAVYGETQGPSAVCAMPRPLKLAGLKIAFLPLVELERRVLAGLTVRVPTTGHS
jgi:hypothetical protein